MDIVLIKSQLSAMYVRQLLVGDYIELAESYSESILTNRHGIEKGVRLDAKKI